VPLTTNHIYCLQPAAALRVPVAVRSAKSVEWIDFMPPGWFG
jgi:hypothetical protein